MRRYKVFILILLGSLAEPLYACSYYPYGEDIRYYMLDPRLFKYGQYTSFYYSSNGFTPSGEVVWNSTSEEYNTVVPDFDYIHPNILFWGQRCKRIPAEAHIYSALYIKDREIFDRTSANEFVRYLYAGNDTDAIEYLKFAARCSPLNTFLSDPWERSLHGKLPARTQQIREALKRAAATKDQELKKRYAFLAIRLAYYDRDSQTVKQIYKEHFGKKGKKGVIDYWAMYFNTLYLPEGAYRNYQASLVFANAPDKRFAVHDVYDKSIPITATLQYAKTGKEKAAVWLLAGIRTHGKTLENIRSIYLADSKSDGWEFLLLRELNKLEDWIYTPYYTHFEPSVDDSRSHAKSFSLLQQRINEDRAYAFDVLDFVNSVNSSSAHDPLFLKIAKAYLYHLTGESSQAAEQLENIEKRLSSNKGVRRQVQMLKAIASIAAEKPGSAYIPERIMPIIKRETRDSDRFLFAIAKELEFKGNTSDAAFILSRVNSRDNEERSLFWRTRKFHATLYDDIYYNYFDYLDAAYSEKDLEQIIHQLESAGRKNSFERWKTEGVKKEISRFYELLGTKYLRKNRLEKALEFYRKVNDTLWTSQGHRIYAYLDSNPFYTNLYNEHGTTEADTIRFTKTTVIKSLLQYLKQAEDEKDPNRDYYYFLVANCYLNMSQYGNSWAMKRYYWSSRIHLSKLEDDDDYFGCLMAKKYYLKAKRVTKSKKFGALCLRMAGRCEKNRLISQMVLNDDYGPSTQTSWDTLFERNKYYSQLKKEYPDYYDDLIGNCGSFDAYFLARR